MNVNGKFVIISQQIKYKDLRLCQAGNLYILRIIIG